jgi:hypothetical protein
MSREAFKLLAVRKDGTIGPLFINRKQRLPIGEWLQAEDHPTKGYAHRPGWHCTAQPRAPHLTLNPVNQRPREWFRVLVEDYEEFIRPDCQGGIWLLAQRMKVLGRLD